MIHARVRPTVGLIVVAVHLGLAVALVRVDDSLKVNQRTSSTRTDVALLWVRTDAAPPEAAAESSPAKRSKWSGKDSSKDTNLLIREAVQAPADSEVVNQAPLAITQPSYATPSPPEPPASAPLNLRLPRSAPASKGNSEMARDAHQPTPLTHEQRLARDLGTDDKLLETITNQGRRYTSGRTCVEVRASQASQLDPFNTNTQPMPKLASRC